MRHEALSTIYPKYPEPSRLKTSYLEDKKPLAIQVQTLPLEGPMILRAYKKSLRMNWFRRVSPRLDWLRGKFGVIDSLLRKKVKGLQCLPVKPPWGLRNWGNWGIWVLQLFFWNLSKDYDIFPKTFSNSSNKKLVKQIPISLGIGNGMDDLYFLNIFVSCGLRSEMLKLFILLCF